MKLTILVFKDYGIVTVSDAKAYKDYERTVALLKTAKDFVAAYEMEIQPEDLKPCNS